MNQTDGSIAEAETLNAGIYRLHDYWAMEDFDDPKYNKDPHRTDCPESNGHRFSSSQKIDPSLEGKTVKDVVDFIAERGGRFRKEHSLVRGISVEYICESRSADVEGMPLTIRINFDKYIEQGKRETISLIAVPYSQPSEA